MSKKHKIPIKEATGEKNLVGSYLISFRLSKISEQDSIIISDIIEGLARTFEHSNGLPKISSIDIKKTDVNGTPLSQKPLKIGDYVSLNQKVVVTTNLSQEENTYIVGNKLTAENLGEIELTLPEESQAIINAMKGDDVELIDFDSAVTVTLLDKETGLEKKVLVNIDSIKLKQEYLDKIGE